MIEFVNAHMPNGMVLMIAVLLVLVIAYRYYSAFLAAKVLALDPNRATPAHTMADGQNYHATNKWVLFGHHFAAIAGAGPLLGPVLALQYGVLPGLLWILIGVCLAGAVQDFTILVLSTRSGGRSLAQMAFSKIGGAAGTAATIGILFILIIALAGLGKAVTKSLGGTRNTYDAGTQFLAGEHSVIRKSLGGNIYTYVIPQGGTIVHPDGTKETVGAAFELTSTPEVQTSPPVDLEVMRAASATQKKIGPGLMLEVKAGAVASGGVAGSSWGIFTIAMTIPIALFIGWYMHSVRKKGVLEASIIGGLLTLGAVWLGGTMDAEGSLLHPWREYFNLTESQVALAIAVYGFIAAVLPVWVLLCPRDYLSSFLKIGMVAVTVVGVIVAHPVLQAEGISTKFLAGGPVVSGAVFPFVFITIMCGAISGFHALVASGTTPKMLDNERQARPIGYGAMLIEGLVAIMALIAAASMPAKVYYPINASPREAASTQWAGKIAELEAKDQGGQTLEDASSKAHENLQGRTGGAVSLAVGIADVFDQAARNVLGTSAEMVKKLEGMFPYWYHFVIMFEALFILTTIDTGTRVGRFLLQETMGKWIHPSLGKTASWPSAIIATGVIVGGWWYFIDANSFAAIWAMFGVANQMLAVMALAIASVGLAEMGKRKYLWVTLGPMCFVGVTTTAAALLKLKEYFSAWSGNNAISAVCTLLIVICTAVIVVGAMMKLSQKPLREPTASGA